ncbi:MAG: ABC transporter ATP-binding protein [Actinomycetaceae bacterium]|nr:ABC transporter ATP-binding protein [Actinomycetaceae bacterium]MDU0969717.1 ABC transporter ATP-binding protein [Actinomycetaceae bacterium]
MAQQNNEPVIIADDIVKDFTLRNTHTLKEMIVWQFKGRGKEMKNQFRAIDHVSFTLHHGETVGLIGFNGSGKSTMLKMLSGVMRPSSGEIGVKGRVAGLIEVGAGFHPDLTGRENVFLNGAILGMTQKQIEDSFDSILEFSEIGKFVDTEVKFYSSGMFLRLAFSVAVHTDPDIFLIDEILAVGDEPFQKKCLAKIDELREAGKSLVIVSHDLDMMRRFCDRGILLDHGKKIVDGTIEEAVERLRS